eukprot:3798925-Pleurochrysis_carterae.AAC.1
MTRELSETTVSSLWPRGTQIIESGHIRVDNCHSSSAASSATVSTIVVALASACTRGSARTNSASLTDGLTPYAPPKLEYRNDE